MSRLRASLLVVALVWPGVAGCGGTGSGPLDDGSDDQSESGWFLEGTCVVRNDAGEKLFCEEEWGQDDGDPGHVTEARQASKEACELTENGEWTNAEEACPTGDGYVGTCRKTTDGGQRTLETYYYEGDVYFDEVPSNCEMDGHTWVVE